MDRRILVVYATRYGATAEIAEAVAQVLREAGLRADVRPADRVGDLASYEAVVLGSAIYVGQWLKEAVTFLKTNAQALAERKVWLFSSGPTGEGDPVALVDGKQVPDALQPTLDCIRPRGIAVFHGVLDTDELSFVERVMIKNIQPPLGDFRDWDAITSWATAIAGTM